MVKIKKRNKAEAEIPSSSMSDIAFLLLIFFLVSTVIDVDTGIGMTLPDWQDNPETANISKDRMAALNVNEFGDVLLNNKVIAIPQIRENLKERIVSKINEPKNKKLIVSIKTDRKTNYNLYIQTLDQVKAAYFEVRGDYALATWGKKLYDCNDEENQELKEKIPIIISIAEPEKVNQ